MNPTASVGLAHILRCFFPCRDGGVTVVMAPAIGVARPLESAMPQDAARSCLLERLDGDHRVAVVRNPFARLVHLHQRLQEGDPACRAIARALRWPGYGGDSGFDGFVRKLAELPAHELDALIPVQASALCLGDVAIDRLLPVDGDPAGQQTADRCRPLGIHSLPIAGKWPRIAAATAARIVALYGPDFALFGYDTDPAHWRRSPARMDRPFAATEDGKWGGNGGGGLVRRILAADRALAVGDAAAAEAALRGGLERGEADGRLLPDIRGQLAGILIDGGRLAEAEALLRPCLVLMPLNPGWRRAQARLLQRRDRPAEAARFLLAAFQRGLPEPADAAALGDAVAASGDGWLAAAAGRLLLDVAGGDPECLAALSAPLAARLAPKRPTRVAMQFLDALAGPGGDGGLAARLHDTVLAPLRAARWQALSAAAAAAAAAPPADTPVGTEIRPAGPVKPLGVLMEQAAGLEELREHKRRQLLRHTLSRYPHLFQPGHYAHQIAGEELEGLDLREHFIRSGSRTGKSSPNPFFSYGHYQAYREEPAEPLVDSLVHFATVGAAAGCNPGPLFGVAPYVARHPELAGSQGNPLDDWLARGDRPAKPGAAPEAAPEALPAHIRADLDWLRAVDPALSGIRYGAWNAPDKDEREAALLGELYGRLRAAVGEGFTHLIVAPWLWHPGGAERIGQHLLRLLMETQGAANVVMLGADLPTRHEPELPAGARLVSLRDLADDPHIELRVELLRRLIIDFRPKCVFNLNSAAAWEMMRRHARTLAGSTGFYAIIFSNAVSAMGEPIGYSYFLADCLRHMKGAVVDNSSIVNSVYRLTPLLRSELDKLHVVYTPVPDMPVTPPSARTRPRQSLWMSRFAPEKRMDVLERIARRMPDRRHLVYGSHIDGVRRVDLDGLRALDNVEVRGRYASLADIPAADCDAFIYTSNFDGLPIVLLEATAMGLPIVAPDVGGISDLISAETGWLVSGPDAVDEYVAAIREIQSKPELARRKVTAAQKLLRERHDWPSFHRSLKALPGFIED